VAAATKATEQPINTSTAAGKALPEALWWPRWWVVEWWWCPSSNVHLRNMMSLARRDDDSPICLKTALRGLLVAAVTRFQSPGTQSTRWLSLPNVSNGWNGSRINDGQILETRSTRLKNGRKSRSGYVMRGEHAADG
jgi:hypothetical protein